MPRARTYGDPYSLPNVNGMTTAGGADYNDNHPDSRFGENVIPFFPTSFLGRIQTPIARLGCLFGKNLTAWDPRYGPRR